jgi:hypothetical protein
MGINMKKAQIIIYAIACIAFYSGAVFFFIDGNNAAGTMGMVAGTLSLAALLMNLRKQK